ncbi:hypothetical protein B0H19DRAFT_1056778 [Mycena capillaripes]|nr:hypothetical protein B0H19DRAFT_1056778 [Mycena capillaripes]
MSGSAPDAISRVNKALRKNEDYTQATENDAYVLQALAQYGTYLTQAEAEQLGAALRQFETDIGTFKNLHIQRNEIKYWSMVEALKKDKEIRQAASKMLDASIIAWEVAQSATEKAIFKRVAT